MTIECDSQAGIGGVPAPRLDGGAGCEAGAVERLRQSYAAFNLGEWARAFEPLDEAFELHDHRLPDVPVERGRDALADALALMGEALGGLRLEPMETIELGQQVLVRVHASGRGRGTGAAVGGAAGHLWTVRGGRALRLDVYPTWSEALAAIGTEQVVRSV